MGRSWIRILERGVCARQDFSSERYDTSAGGIVDLRFRDQKDTMERPFFSLSKSKRMKPIEYVNRNDDIFVTVQPHQDHGNDMSDLVHRLAISSSGRETGFQVTGEKFPRITA